MRIHMVSRVFSISLITVLLSACGGGGSTVPSTPLSRTVHPMAKAGPITYYPISRLIAVQGTCGSVCGGTGHYLSFLAENGVSGCPASYNLFSKFDYAGITNAILKQNSGGAIDLHTTQTGQLSYSPQPDGTVVVKAEIDTTNALAYSRCETDSSMLFGYSPDEVAGGATPALATTQLSIVFTMPSFFSPLPDIVQLTIFPNTMPGYSFSSLKFNGTAYGALRLAFGVPEGTHGRMDVSQVNLTQHGLAGFADQDEFAVESEHLAVSK